MEGFGDRVFGEVVDGAAWFFARLRGVRRVRTEREFLNMGVV